MNIFRSSTQGLLTKQFLKVTKTMTYDSSLKHLTILLWAGFSDFLLITKQEVLQHITQN